MAQELDYTIPFNDLIQYVPQNLRNAAVKGLIDNLFNRQMTHDESVPLYGYVGRRPTAPDDRTARIPQQTVERDLNAVIPVLSFDVGAETQAFTVQDLIAKAKAIGISDQLETWLYSQSNNYLPPIDIDRFANFYNYYWIAKALPATQVTPWNAELLPEYYTIAQPRQSDLDKLNVVTATTAPITLTGSGFLNQSFIVTFSSPLDFTISLSAPLPGGYSIVSGNTGTLDADPTIDFNVSFDVTGPAGTKTLVTFSIVRDPIFDSNGILTGYGSFVAGDQFVIDTIFLSRTYNVSFTGSLSVKGRIKSVVALNTYQTIGGVVVEEGQRVLVKNNSPVEDGIYIVSAQGWSRANDYAGSLITAGARTWVRSGVHAGMLFTSDASNGWSGVVANSNTNDWQESNFWVHGSQLSTLNLTKAQVTQAVRPIIEYNSKLQLNSFVSNGLPSDAGTPIVQQKTEFNQLPFFDLFRYDGTHSGLVSSIFYYVEDLTAELDLDLQKRVKTSPSDSADYIFNHGLADANGDLLFYKDGGNLKSIWHAGYTEPVSVDQTFIGDGNGTLTNIVPSDTTQQQVWILRALSPTTFSVEGSKVQEVPGILSVGTPYTNLEFSCLVTAGSTPFSVDDTFIFRIGNREMPRYSYRTADDAILDLYGGSQADTTGIGAYQVSRSFIHNPYNDNRAEVLEGTLYSHFRSILTNQLVEIPTNYAFGGTIKNWTSPQTLLASLLMQRDSTLISLIDLAQRQYDVGLNTIVDIYKQTIVQYFTSVGVVDSGNSTKLNALLDSILAIRANDHDVRTVLFDTTSGVTGIPATLPQLGIVERVEPEIAFDVLLGRYLITHHDGHNSNLYVDSVQFRRDLLNNNADITVTRYDGAVTPAVASFTTAEPVRPYRGTLWIRPDGVESDMLSFDVDYEIDPPIAPAVGATWYQRNVGAAGLLSIWDGVQWVAQPSHSGQWRIVNLADTLNQLIVLVERRLYDAINPNRQMIDFSSIVSEPNFQEQQRRELFSFAALNGLDPLGSDYVSTNAFTWNYSQASLSNFAPLDTPSVPARWNNVLTAHQRTVAGVLETTRPNLQPWRLLGFATFSAWWSSLSGAQQTAYTPYATPEDLTAITSFSPIGYARVASTTPSVTTLSGLQIIDGVQLNANDVVLLQAEVGSENNGLWVAKVGAWTRANVSLTVNAYVTILEGDINRNTTWALSAPVAALNVDPVLFKQVRYWSNALWADVQAARPTLRLSVDTTRDELLPPYVNSSSAQGSNALTNVIPATGLTAGYVFGEDGPVEAVWESSLEYGYSLARSLARFDPLKFLSVCWGFNWVKVDGITYDGYDISAPGHKRFRLQGDVSRQIERTASALTLSLISSADPIDLTLTFDASEEDSGSFYQSFTLRSGSTALAYVREGVTTTVSGPVVITNLRIEDNGQPFRFGDRFRITANADGSNLLITFEQAVRASFIGFGQIFANALRAATIDTSNSFALDAYRNWDVRMGYRAGGLVATDDLLVRTDNDTLSSSSFELLFKKNEVAKDLWIHGLRITVQTVGTAVAKGGGFAPYDSTSSVSSIVNLPNPNEMNSFPSREAFFASRENATDWVFLIEGYNPRYIPIQYYSLDSSSGADFQTFNVLDQSNTTSIWKQYRTISGTVSTNLPLVITGLQNVVDFLFGYSRFLIDAGWHFDTTEAPGTNIDAATGRARTWQLEVEKIIDQCYLGINVEQGIIANPFSDVLRVRQDTGLLAPFSNNALFDITGNSGVFDIAGVRFPIADLFVTRGNLISTITAAAPIYSAHAQIDEYEHLFIFNYFVEDSIQNGILYDPFSGSRVVTYKFNGRRQAGKTFRPEFGGHYLAGNQVRQNIQASTDNIANFYDANRAFENNLTTRHSLALLGFNNKAYFDNLDITDKSQFNFWRGLVQSKGTNMSIGAYLNNNRFEDARIDEYWAYKVAEYGDSRQRTFPELKISVDDSVQQFTQLQFDAPDEASQLPNFTQISRFDENRWFSIDDLDQDAYFKAEVIGSFDAEVQINEVITLSFVADYLVTIATTTATFVRINATTLLVTGGGRLTVEGYGPATPRYNPIKLFNYVDDQLIEEIPLWHPAIGQHNPIALESINIISSQNPAKYNFSTQVANNNSYDPLRPWGSNEIGRVWFDTSNLFYIPYSDETIFPDRAERLSRWGTLADFSTLDVYEWVQSAVPPSEYNALAALQAGDADLDASVKAAGEVALQQTYSRNRLWSIRPIAWSQAAVPIEGAHPSFASSYDSILYRTDDTISLERGLFSDYGISAGMRIGAWDPNPAKPMPLSEHIITSNFTKEIVDVDTLLPLGTLSSTTALSCDVEVSVAAYTPAVGQLLVTEELPVTVRRSIDDGTVIDEWESTLSLKVTEVDGTLVDVVTITRAVGNEPEVLEVLEQPFIAAVAEQQFRPAHGGQPYIAPVVGQPFIEHVDEVPATSGYQVIKFGPSKLPSDPTGLVAGVKYTARVSFNGAGAIDLVIADGADAQTFGVLVTLLNAQLPGAPLSFTDDGNLVFTSPMTGLMSTVEVTDVVIPPISPDTVVPFQLFASLNDFDSISLAVEGAEAIPEIVGQPYIADFAGQPYIEPDPGQAYVAPVAGQPYIAPVAAIPAPHLFGATVSVTAGERFEYSLPTIGLTLTVMPTVTGTFPADELMKAIVDALGAKVLLRDAVEVLDVVTLSNVPDPSRLSNNENDPEYVFNNGIGWRAWSVPTQAQLTADGRQPNSSWVPYLGDFTLPGLATLETIQDAIAYNRAPLTLNNGTIVQRYETTWEDWVVLKDIKLTATQTTTPGPLVFIHTENIDEAITSVYVNGIAQLKAAYTIVGPVLTLLNVAVGSTATVIIRRYTPSTNELAFDPSVADDLSIQQQYKQDYEYVSQQIRDAEGSFSSTLYYFWVKNKSIPAVNKRLSIQAIAQELTVGPDNFLTFQNILPATATLPIRYDAITISGLSYIIAKDDTFKLRFTRNFTLRDDPQQLDLKDTHTEWSLIRPSQRTKIPEALWLRLTDSAAGEDAAGNAVPALRRVLYDERNGTTTRYGFGAEQALAPQDLLVSSILYTILNTKLINTNVPPNADGVYPPDFIEFLNFDDSDSWFATPASTRQIMTDIWTTAKIVQINEIFFAALNDILAANFEMTDIFKTSRLSAYSIKVISAQPVIPTFE
jgi:hypothetical protein